jgi:DNA-cytosine methyltransferase
MKYLSLFTGIGGFEQAIHKVFPGAECIGYSEIKPHAVKVYEYHYPDHINLGDITKLTKEDITKIVKEKGCDIIFGGFPCKNLSSLATIQGGNTGLEGKKSGLFYEMLRIVKIINQVMDKKVHVIFENNASMSNKNKKLITDTLQSEYPNIHMTMLNSSDFGVQCRRRMFWTDFPISKEEIFCVQTWDDVLDPVGTTPNISDNYVNCLNKSIDTKTINKTYIRVIKQNDMYSLSVNTINDTYKSRWQMSFHSDTATDDTVLPYSYPKGKCRPITASFGNHNVLVDRRVGGNGEFALRMFSFTEIEKLFGYSEKYTALVSHSKSKRRELLGNSVVVPVIEYIFKALLLTKPSIVDD